MRLLRRITVSVTVVLLSAIFGTGSAFALSGPYWHDDGVVLQNGYSNANVVGFWQALLLSNGGCGFTIDGVFGSATESRTVSVQTSVAGVTGDGVVGSNTWLYTQFAQYDGSNYRLVSTGSGYFYYYGGGASNAHYYWNSSNPYVGDMWLFLMEGTGVWYNSSASTNGISSHYFSC